MIGVASIRFIDVSGVGNSGKGAAVDLLREFGGLWVPEYWFEFDLLRVPGGILDLYARLCEDWSPIRSHAALRAFDRIVEQMGVDPAWWCLPKLLRSTSQRYDRRFQGRFRDLCRQYSDGFVVGRYRAEWPYDALSEPRWKLLWRKMAARFGFRQKMLREVLLVDGRDFSNRTVWLLSALYAQLVGHDTHSVVFNNGFEPFNPVRALDLLPNSRQLVVTRDPRDVYVSGQTAGRVAGVNVGLQAFDNDGFNKSFLATDDIKLFVARYRLYHQKLYRGPDPRVMRIAFEELTGDYESSVRRVHEFLDLGQSAHIMPRKYFDPDKSARNVGLWRKYSQPAEIRYIEQHLHDYLVG